MSNRFFSILRARIGTVALVTVLSENLRRFGLTIEGAALNGAPKHDVGIG